MTAPIEAPRRKLGVLPGLNGVRAIGVLCTLIGHASYHSGSFDAFRGAFFAISLFFVLSGFLITAQLMLELEANGTIGLRQFWSRRFRRLMPGALVGAVLVLAFGWFAADSSQLATLQGDVAEAVTYTTNWGQLFSGEAYANQLGSPTPLLHYWSLAIEEQFYLMLPIVLLGAHRLGRGRRNAVPIALGALMAASLVVVVALATSADLNPDRMYYGTDARSFEFLTGCALGVYFVRNRERFARHARALDVVGWIGFVVSMYLWSTTDLSDRWIYHGGLQLGILPAAAMVLGAISGGSLSRFLSIRPLHEIGTISYGVYVVHWPIVLWLSPSHTGIDALVLLPVQIAAALILAWASYTLLERRVQQRTLLPSPRIALGAAAILSATLVLVAGPISARANGLFDLDERTRALEEIVGSADEQDGIRIGFFGDSTSVVLSLGTWSAQTDDGLVPAGSSMVGWCGLTGVPDVLINDQPLPRDGCERWPERWTDAIAARPVDIAVVTTTSDVLPASVAGGPYRTLDDPEGARYLLDQMLRAVDLLDEAGAHVVWVRQAPVVFGVVDGVQPDPPWRESNPELMRRYNELVDQLPTLRPGIVDVVDLEAYLSTLPGGVMDQQMRPDLLHLSYEAAAVAAREWLRPELVALAAELGISPSKAGAP